MLADVYQETEERMEKAITALLQELNSIRTGRANPSLVELLPIEYYGTQTPLQELAGISVPESRSLLIRPYDPSSLKNIEKAFGSGQLGHEHVNSMKTKILRNISSITFGGSDRKTIYLGNLQDNRIYALNSPVAGI